MVVLFELYCRRGVSHPAAGMQQRIASEHSNPPRLASPLRLETSRAPPAKKPRCALGAGRSKPVTPAGRSLSSAEHEDENCYGRGRRCRLVFLVPSPRPGNGGATPPNG